MIHKDYANKGFGKLIYQALEQYVKSKNSDHLRIDVVINYDDNVLKFWAKNGFNKIKEVELNWTGKILPAVIMKKYL